MSQGHARYEQDTIGAILARIGAIDDDKPG